MLYICFLSGHPRSPCLFCAKLFFGPFSPMLHAVSFISITNFTKLECPHRAVHCAITSCILCFLVPLFLSEASLPPLQVTDSFHYCLPLPSSFPISGLAKSQVKLRLFTFSWRAFVSAHLLMLSPFVSREVLLVALPVFLGTYVCSVWN